MKLGSLSRTGMLCVAILLAAALAVPAAATARITVPPGSTEGDQYFEEAPNGSGSGGVNKGDGGTGGSPVAATPELNNLGTEGQAAAALANANRPPKTVDRATPAQQTTPTEGAGGMGFWFPLLLGGAAVAAVAFLMRRRLNPA